jgi:hypothetical protein
MGLSCSAAAMSTLNSLNQQSQAQASPQKPPVLVPVCLAPALALILGLILALPNYRSCQVACSGLRLFVLFLRFISSLQFKNMSGGILPGPKSPVATPTVS